MTVIEALEESEEIVRKQSEIIVALAETLSQHVCAEEVDEILRQIETKGRTER